MARGTRLAKAGKIVAEELQNAPEAEGSTAVAEKAETVIIDGHTMGADATADEIAVVEKAEGFAAGSLAKAVAEKQITATWHFVEVSAKASPTGKGATKAYVKLQALNIHGAAAICKGVINPAPAATEENPKPQTGVCDYFNYGSDLDRKAPVRALILRGLEGPEKAVKKAVIGALAGEMEADEIRDFIKGLPKFRGVEGLDKLIDAALASQQ